MTDHQAHLEDRIESKTSFSFIEMSTVFFYIYKMAGNGISLLFLLTIFCMKILVNR